MAREESSVGVRELRQNLSKYLRRIQRGETLEVTDHGQPVALLTPLPKPSSALERLIASGRITRPTRDLAALLPPKGTVSSQLGDALLADREDRL